MVVFIGIDMSLRSPAIAIMTIPEQKTTDSNFSPSFEYRISFRYVPQNKKQMKLRLCHNHVTMEPMDLHVSERKKEDGDRMVRYSNVVEEMVSIIQDQKSQDPCVQVYMEDYAYSIHSSSTSILCELGGILKYRLYQNDISVNLLSPTWIKKQFTGKGNANKIDMIRTYHDLGMPNIYDLFGIERRRRDQKNVPSPISDIVDSFAIVHTVFRQDVRNSGQCVKGIGS
jgi:Holliday junction resolvasome RuvABC endonuclease subunit